MHRSVFQMYSLDPKALQENAMLSIIIYSHNLCRRCGCAQLPRIPGYYKASISKIFHPSMKNDTQLFKVWPFNATGHFEDRAGQCDNTRVSSAALIFVPGKMSTPWPYHLFPIRADSCQLLVLIGTMRAILDELYPYP
jgi:hypothetical protein